MSLKFVSLSNGKLKTLIIFIFLSCSLLFYLNLFENTAVNSFQNGWISVKFKKFFLNHTSFKKDKNPLVLLWTPYFGKTEEKSLKNFLIGGTFKEMGCDFTSNKSEIGNAEAIVFHAWPGDLKLESLPSNESRSKDQVWIFMTQESPYLTPKPLQEFNGVFNWTMSYRLDSDVEFSYGFKQLKPELNKTELAEIDKEIEEIVKNKRFLVAGVISKCETPSKREDLIKKLKGHIQVDIYGKCGIPVVKEGPKSSNFWKVLGKQYKFYLAFENALCLDYVTEKLWRTLQNGMVPVVYGSADYTKLAPPGSFINSKDFNSSRELANYLEILSRDPLQYKKYFEWKKSFKIVRGLGFAPLCKKLKEMIVKKDYKTVENLQIWWENGGINSTPSCQPPKLFQTEK